MSEIGALILQIVVIISVALFFIGLLSSYIYKKIKGLPTGECAYCHKGASRMLKDYHKMYPKTNK